MVQMSFNGKWREISQFQSKPYVCGHCGSHISSNTGYQSNHGSVFIHLCHQCNLPTLFYGDHQVPGPKYGNDIQHLPSPEVEELYKEARECMKVNAFTASVLCSRKLLMNIAVSEGAKQGENFVQYIDYLVTKGLVTPKSKPLVDHVRKTGNEATHEIKAKTTEEAKLLIDFLEMLLKVNYEYPGNLPGGTP